MNLHYNSMNIVDRIQATLVVNGETITQLCDTEAGSVSDIVKKVYAQAGSFCGFARLTIRNQSQGWIKSLPLASCIA